MGEEQEQQQEEGQEGEQEVRKRREGRQEGEEQQRRQGWVKGSRAAKGRGDKVNGIPGRNCHPEAIWGRGGRGRRKPQDCHLYLHSWTPSVGGVEDVWRRQGKNCSHSKGLNRRDVRYHGA